MKNIILTGDRPTGKLHIGHFVGSLKERVRLQNEENYDNMFVMIADAQALTDNFNNVAKVQDNILEVALDYLAVGLDPNRCTIFIQSEIPQLTEYTFYFMNLVTLSRLHRNPTVKYELQQRGFNKSIPVGFLTYPVSQAADITAFNANIIPVGEDQLPMIEQTREIVRTFNNLYKTDLLIEPNTVLPSNSTCLRLPGIDGKAKMSKSLNNCIYLSDSPDEIKNKISMMYTDPNHIRVSDPGQIEGNVVFTYLDAFCEDRHFKDYYPEFNNLNELKMQYSKGGIGDSKTKKFLNCILQEILEPIRIKRADLAKDKQYIYDTLFKASDFAKNIAEQNLKALKSAMGINYRNIF